MLARTVLRTLRDPETLSERLRLIEEELEGVVQLQILASGRRIFEPEPAELWIPSIEETRRTCRTRMVLEWGEQDTPAVLRKWAGVFPETGWMIDPDRHRVLKKQLPPRVHYKLHGWHPARWVRRYGPQRTEELVAKIRKLNPSPGVCFLVLSHSGRMEEVGLFSRAITSPER